MFLAQNFFGRRAPEVLDLHYKAHPYCDHVAKFRGDRPTELGDLVAKEIKLEIWAEPNVRPPGGCASMPWSIYNACKNLRGRHPLRAEI